MVVAEFFLIAFVVGIMTKTWLGFLGTFIGLYALYRFTRLSALLVLALSLYWGVLGFHLGAALGGVAAGALLAVTGFVVGLGVHRGGVLAAPLQQRPVDRGPSADSAEEPRMSPYPPRPLHGTPHGEVIDAEYRVVS